MPLLSFDQVLWRFSNQSLGLVGDCEGGFDWLASKNEPATARPLTKIHAVHRKAEALQSALADLKSVVDADTIVKTKQRDLKLTHESLGTAIEWVQAGGTLVTVSGAAKHR